MLLIGKTAVVTGAGSGIGKAVALKLAAEGASVCLLGRTEASLLETAHAIGALNGSCSVYRCDVTDPEQVARVIGQIEEAYGRIDILVNNAGISREQPLMDMPVEVFDEILATNLRSVMLMTKAVLPVMVKQGSGNIVNIASAAALRGLPGSAAYSASKAGVVALTQALGDEMRPYGLRINVLCPGPVDTELFRKSERRDFILKAGGDLFDTETIANGVLFLASDLSKGMNSQTLTLRGFNRW